MRTWFAASGLSDPIEQDGWVFTESQGAYAALRIVSGGQHWEDSKSRAKGRWLYCENEYSPVITELAQKSSYKTFDQFRSKVRTSELSFHDNVLQYTGNYGDKFTFHADFSESPEINGVTVDDAPAKAFDSPFLQSQWDSGIVQIQKEKRRLTLDFNHD